APSEKVRKPVLALESVGRTVLAVVEGVGILQISREGDIYNSEYLAGDASTGITDLAVDGDVVYVESTTGLYQLHYKSEAELELLDADIRRIHVDSNGDLFAVDKTRVLGIFDDGQFHPKASIPTELELVSIAADKTGTLWAASSSELFRFNHFDDEEKTGDTAVRKFDGLDRVTSIFIDSENSLWLSTGAGLTRFLGDRFRHYRLRTSDDLVTVWGVAEDRLGRFWFATQNNLLLRGLDETLTVVGEKQGLPAGTVRDVVVDAANTVWAGMTHRGLFSIDAESLQADYVEGTKDLEVLDVDIAADGAIWFSTIRSGVFRYDPEDARLTRYPTPKPTSVYTLDTWEDGSIWYAADEIGIVHLQPQKDGGFKERIIVDTDNDSRRLFNHLRLTGPDAAWISTEEGGVFYYESGQFTDYGAHSPLADQTAYLVEPLDNGTVVVGGEQGLYQFVPGEPRFIHYSPQLGFIGMETNVHSSFLDSTGCLWIGTVDGATRMDTSQPMQEIPEPTPTIIRVESESDGRPIHDGQELAPTDFGAHIEFAAISVLAPSAMQYSYRLVGADQAWGTPTTNRSVNYPKVPPGSYEFMVRARFSGGEWSPHVASQRFTVLPYFWQQPWFVLGALILGLLIVRYVVAYRTRNVEWMNETLRAQVEERTRSIETARQNLQKTNERLSQEVEARAEIETRFRQAFQNAPIGLGLIDAQGVLFDANPALAGMFWPECRQLPDAKFVDNVADEDRVAFEARYDQLVQGLTNDLDMNLACIGHDGEDLKAVASLSAVRNEGGDFLYAVFQIQDITESLKLTVQLEYQASYDELTELLNRRAFETQLEKAWKSGAESNKQSYLMFMDLDQFKVVNDTSGHTAGDQLLRAVSEILNDSVRANDIVGRLGGDEFGIILWECPTDVARRIAESIRSRIETFRFHWDSETYRIGVSIGGVPIDKNVGDINELQQLADAACYAAKEAGRNRVHMVDGDADSARVHRGEVRWVQRIREAMDRNRFAIYAQPIRPIIANADEPERLEILLRLRDPESRKLIPPGAFLPAAERYGLSVELDKWVVQSLLDTLFIHSAFKAEQRSYWINLSGSSVGDKRFAEFLKAAIARSPLPPGTINFEITETAVIRSVSEAGNLMAELREMGCQFALDDFGSGLSSFAYLKKLPVDYIKIDGMFVRDLIHDHTDRIFVKSIIDIAETLNIKTIAEFVENEETLKIVAELGAGYAQGFAIGRPFELAPRFPRTANSDVAIFRAKAG
nr:EAL domain-containing protein [Woeseiaceae bacterium]